jgi:AraC family transcriptional regulator of adaptative response / methylphosphotriester-DNA alkyltransferase methyltransferase
MPSRPLDRRLQRLAGAVVASHYRRPLTIAAVARALSTSPRQLQRAYAACGDSSFSEDLARARLSAAAELLAVQPISVRDVARLVGYREPSHFARAFRRRYGLAPARFRAAARAGAGSGRPPLSSPPTAATSRGS